MKCGGFRTGTYITMLAFIMLSCAISVNALTPQELLTLVEKGHAIRLDSFNFLADIPMPEDLRSFVMSITCSHVTVHEEQGTKIVKSTLVYNTMPFDIAITILGQSYSIALTFSSGIRFADIDSLLAGFDRLEITTCTLVFSQKSYQDTMRNIAIVPEVVNVLLNIRVRDDIEKLLFLAGHQASHITAQGILKEEVVGSNFTVAIPGTISVRGLGQSAALTLDFYFKKLAAGIHAGPPELVAAIKTNCTFTMPDTQKIMFHTEFSMSFSKLMMITQIMSPWQHAFGIQGLVMNEFGCAVSIDYQKACTSPGVLALSELCLQGNYLIGKRACVLQARADLATLPAKWTIQGMFDGGMYTSDLTTWYSQLHGVSEEDIEYTLPMLRFSDVAISIVPRETRKQAVGIYITSELDLLGARVLVSIELDAHHMRIVSEVPEVKIGPLRIQTSSEQPGSFVAGIDAEHKLGFAELKAPMNIDMRLFGTVQEMVMCSMDHKGISCVLSTSLFDDIPVDVQIEGRGALSLSAQSRLQQAQHDTDFTYPLSRGLQDEAQWQLKVTTQEYYNERLRDLLQELAQKHIADVQAGSEEQKQEINALNTDIARLEQAIKREKQQVEQLLFERERAIERAEQEVTKSKSRLDELHDHKHDIDGMAVAYGRGPVRHRMQHMARNRSVPAHALQQAVSAYLAQDPYLADAVVERLHMQVQSRSTAKERV